jgi:hypothetical protein
MTTFGEITSIADAHFADGLALLRRPGAIAELNDPGTIAAFTHLTAVLARYADRTATGFGPQADEHPIWGPAAGRSAQLLRAARTAAEPPAGAEPSNGELALRLRATADALGCGLDLLASHFTDTQDRERSPTAPVIADAGTSRHLLSLVGKYAAGLTRITELARRTDQATSPALEHAGALLAEVARHTPKTTGPTSVPVAAVAMRSLPARLPPGVGEDRSRVVRGITASAQRLIEFHDEESITTWRAVATSASITHHLADQLLRQLTKGLIQLGHHQGAALISTAAQQLHDAAKQWHVLATRLSKLTTEGRTPFSEPATDAHDLVLRLGRLLHTDPSWTPNLRSGTTLVPTRQLAPDVTKASVLALTVMRSIDAFRIAADRHHSGIEATSQQGHLWESLPARRHFQEVYVPARTKQTQALLHNYQRAQAHDNQATITLGNAVLTLSRGRPQPALNNQATLLMRRAQTRTQPSPAALADAAFPVPIAEAINAPVHQGTAPSPAPSTVSARGRST